MEKNELIITTAKEIFLKTLESKEGLALWKMGVKEDFATEICERFTALTQKLSQVLKNLNL